MAASARRYVLLTLGVAGALVGAVGLFNYVVDPYDLYGHNRLGIYITAEREFKSSEVGRYPHNALLVGNSRMAMIPVKGLDHFQFFNAAFGGGTAEEVYYFLEHFAKNQDLVILGIDLGQGDPVPPQGDSFKPPGITDILNNLLNLRTVEYSVRTISSHLRGIPTSLRPDGSFDAAPWFERWDRPDPTHMNFVLDQMKGGFVKYPGPAKQPLAFYRKIAECLRQRDITCVAVVPPMHEEAAKRVQASPAAAHYDDWRRKLESVFPLVVDLSFSPYSAATNFFKSDPVHFKPDVGVRMLNTEVIPVAIKARLKPENRSAANQPIAPPIASPGSNSQPSAALPTRQ
jgi:hypothetical protein